MPTTVFDYHPSVEILQSFLPPKALLCEPHNLKKAVRSYVLVKCTYGNGLTCSGSFFKFETDWREIAQKNYYKKKKNAHNKQDTQGWITCSNWYSYLEIAPITSAQEIRTNPAPGQLDNKTSNLQFLKQLTVKDFLFNQDSEELDWRNSYQKNYKIDAQKLDQLLQLHPFDVSERVYRYDFTTLSKFGWLEPENQNGTHTKSTGYYRKVNSWSQLIPTNLREEELDSEFEVREVNTDYIFNYELGNFIARFAQSQNKKLLLEAEFIFKYDRDTAARLELVLHKIETNWFTIETQPLKLAHQKFTDSFPQENIVYPVTFFYIKRSPYLFTIQQDEKQDGKITWEAYRLDRIVDVEILPWSNQIVPHQLKAIKQAQQLPTIEDVERYCDPLALGYAFWKPKKWMLLRFNRRHYNRYIANTSRGSIFREIDLDNWKTIELVVQQEHAQFKYYPKHSWFGYQSAEFSPTPEEIDYLKKQTLSKHEYAFCLAKYYQGDSDVFLRLVSWGKNVKVLFPQQLQQQVLEEIKSTFQLYKE